MSTRGRRLLLFATASGEPPEQTASMGRNARRGAVGLAARCWSAPVPKEVCEGASRGCVLGRLTALEVCLLRHHVGWRRWHWVASLAAASAKGGHAPVVALALVGLLFVRFVGRARCRFGGSLAADPFPRQSSEIMGLKAEPTPPLTPADLYKSPSQHGLLLPSPPATLWPPAAKRRLEAAVLIQDSSPAASLWWESSLASCWLAAKVASFLKVDDSVVNGLGALFFS